MISYVEVTEILKKQDIRFWEILDFDNTNYDITRRLMMKELIVDKNNIVEDIRNYLIKQIKLDIESRKIMFTEPMEEYKFEQYLIKKYEKILKEIERGE